MSFLRFLVSVLLFAAAATPCRGQVDSTEEPIPSLVLSDVRIALDDAERFWTAPARFTTWEWIATGGAVSGIVALMGVDGRLQNHFAAPGGEQKDLWDIPTLYGEITFAGALTLGTYTAGLVGHDREMRTTSRLMFESLALSASAMLAIRFLAGRSRPSENHGPRDFKGFRWDNAEESFPSGHAVVTFAMSTVLAERADHPLARVALYGLATLTAASRVHDNRHWTSDVVAGALLGLAAGFHVVGAERAREQLNPEESSFSVIPLPGGLRMQYTFR
jgi:membrane-associated phospholipid phosphatase